MSSEPSVHLSKTGLRTEKGDERTVLNGKTVSYEEPGNTPKVNTYVEAGLKLKRKIRRIAENDREPFYITHV